MTPSSPDTQPMSAETDTSIAFWMVSKQPAASQGTPDQTHHMSMSYQANRRFYYRVPSLLLCEQLCPLLFEV